MALPKIDVNTVDSNQLPTLSEPYVGPAAMIDYQNVFIKNDGTVLSDTLVFQFKLPNNLFFTHLEFSPREDEEQSKMANRLSRVAHILSRYHDKEKIVDAINKCDDWKGVVAVADKVLSSTGREKRVVNIKVLGQLNLEGKPQLRFPGYVGFIADQDHPLSFSPKERENNAQYMRAITSAPDAVISATVAKDDFGF